MRSISHEDVEDGSINVMTQSAEDITAQQNDADEQINSIFAEVGSDAKAITYGFQVWRVIKDQDDMAFLFKGAPSDLPIMERLRDEYDGGKFHIQIYRNKKRYKQLKVTVEQPRKSTAAVAATVKNDMAELMREMGRQQQDNFNMLKDTVMQMVGKPSQPQPSQMEMMTGMMTLLSGMKAFVTPPAQESFGAEKMMDLLLKGMEIGRENNGGGNETGFMDLAKELIKSPLMGNLAAAAIAPQLPAQLPRPQQILTKPLPAENIVQQTNPQGAPMHNPIISNYLKKLIEKAEKDSDPVLYAEFILDNVNQSIVETYLAREDLIDYLSSIDPRVKNHVEWFTELRDHIIAVLTAPDDLEETDDTTPPALPQDGAPIEITPDHVTDDPKRVGRDT